MPNIQENITRIQGAKSSLKTSIQNKGVTIPDDALIDTYYTYVDQIQTGSSSGSGDYDSTMADKHFTINNNNGWPNSMISATIADGITIIPDNAFSNSGLIKIEIPDSVTSLGSSCFSGCSALTSIEIPSGVTSLDDNCFSNCRSLSSITIYDSVTSLGNSCFSNCYSLLSITIPSGVTSLGDDCFNCCRSLSSIEIPSGVTSIGSRCFNECSGLTSITIPSGVTSLGIYCFGFCYSLSSIIIPDSVTSLGIACFNYCRALTSITFLPTVPPTSGSGMLDNTNNCPIYVPNASVDAYKSAWTEYADRIFPMNPEPTPTGSTENADIDVVYDVTSSTNPTKLFTSGQSIDYFTIDDDSTHHEPTSTEYTFDTTGDHTVHYHLTGDTVGDSCFFICYSLTSITISSGVTSLSDYCFNYCTGLTNIEIPSGVTSLGYFCFGDCYSLSSITIPSGVTNIGSYCFSNCSGLTAITCLPTTPPSQNDLFYNTNNCPIYVPDASVEAYKSAWTTYANRIQPLSSKPE